LGNSALHYAAVNGHAEICEVLLRAGVSRDARTKVNRTPLHLAAQHGHLPVVMLLIDIGVDVHATDMVSQETRYSSSQHASPLREHMGSHNVTYHPAELTFLPLSRRIKAGAQFSDPRGM